MKLLLADKTTVLQIVEPASEDRGGTYSMASNVEVLSSHDALKPIVMFCDEALKRMGEALKPDELEIEFGIEAGAEGGFFGLAKASGNATISVRAKWIGTKSSE